MRVCLTSDSSLEIPKTISGEAAHQRVGGEAYCTTAVIVLNSFTPSVKLTVACLLPTVMLKI